jgi:hypothetical protein
MAYVLAAGLPVVESRNAIEKGDEMRKLLPVLFMVAIASAAFGRTDRDSAREAKPGDAAPAAQATTKFPVNPDGSAAIVNAIDDFDDNVPDLPVGGLQSSPDSFHAETNAVNLTYHGGDVLNVAKVVCIFWGPTWVSGGTDASRATSLQAFRNQLGTSSHYSMLTQYGDSAAIQTTNLAGQPDWFDTTNALPSSGNVTDSVVRAEVARYVAAHGSNSSTIYEVFLPKYVPGTTTLVYSSSGSSTSCGGPRLAYCAYHSSYGSGTGVKYSIEPYPSCSGCQASGWTVAQNMEHFMVHETREAVTDANGNAWYDSSGAEADDKCAWTGLFISNGYGYQPEWSNAVNGCVQ